MVAFVGTASILFIFAANPSVSAVCAPGWFGTNCTSQCHCALNQSCAYDTGHCPNDCAAGWFGSNCQSALGCSQTAAGSWAGAGSWRLADGGSWSASHDASVGLFSWLGLG
ncbi:endothelial cells scavenger receptor [Plakobranchus ocellatus]|uniref:Endothelial cells scavenger receptor n=1 Tax=Plakobranchus ocellatus TaxID=259542 RepID=A0AAV4DGX4_9GAST|nr:endothelial cells scavenger receptor [Plakobranchus ocellatus]